MGLAVLVLLLGGVGPASAAAVVPGFNTTILPRNDDDSSGLVPLGFTANFFGVNFSGAYVNNNGNITFDFPLSTFTPFPLNTTNRQIIAPFFADVDTRNLGSGIVSYGNGTFGGHPAFGVNWPSVGYYNTHADRLNTFQLLLVNRSDTGPGNFDIVFNYDQIQWETGDASGGSGGLGGFSARVGFANGTGLPGTSFEFAGSAINGAFLDGGPNALNSHSNVGFPGRFIFEAREGKIAPGATGVPEPTSLALFGLGGVALAGWRCWRKRKQRA